MDSTAHVYYIKRKQGTQQTCEGKLSDEIFFMQDQFSISSVSCDQMPCNFHFIDNMFKPRGNQLKWFARIVLIQQTSK